MASSATHKYTNRLAAEKSPYLLQHAHNPVDWYPWGDEAFEKARRENKPVFLSVGYSTCHWCHVMERESFEDEEVAFVLNDNFVSIKVDREERPDIDKIYMDVCQAMTGSGGWPLTIVMTPDRKPFFATTYIPKNAMWGRPGIISVLGHLSESWKSEQGKVKALGDRVAEMLQGRASAGAGGAPDKKLLSAAAEQLRGQFDRAHGGFGGSPKFPSPHNLSFLLRRWKRTGDADIMAMVEKTLDGMARGGIYDQVGFGFHRYSVDARWLVPHFEKMLYDQAMLAIAYTEAFQVTGGEEYKRIAEEIFAYVLRDMRATGGGFYSAEDADSEGEEGKFYVWTPEEITGILGGETGELVCRYYGVTPGGNFEGGASILHVGMPLDKFAKKEGMAPDKFAALLEESREKLFAEREKRVHPHKDDKVLTDWNGLMIAALAKGGRVFGEAAYTRAAARSADFILEKMRTPDGRLLHRFRDGEASVAGFLDDYAFMVWGLMELYEATFEVKYLRAADSLNGTMLELFRDKDRGGLFFSGEGNERLIARSKETRDGAYPSGNSVAALNLLRLGRIGANEKLEKEAEELFAAFAARVAGHPAGFTQLLIGLDFALYPGREIVIAGEPGGKDTREMLKALGKRFLPGAVVLLHPAGAAGGEIEKIAPYTMKQEMMDGKATAYVCENFTCGIPITSVSDLEKLLDSKE